MADKAIYNVRDQTLKAARQCMFNESWNDVGRYCFRELVKTPRDFHWLLLYALFHEHKKQYIKSFDLLELSFKFWPPGRHLTLRDDAYALQKRLVGNTVPEMSIASSNERIEIEKDDIRPAKKRRTENKQKKDNTIILPNIDIREASDCVPIPIIKKEPLDNNDLQVVLDSW